MSKVIIITRSTEYSRYSTFQNAIEKRKNCRFNKENELISFLNARKAWIDELKKPEIDNDITSAYKDIVGEEPFDLIDKGLKLSIEARNKLFAIEAIKHLMKAKKSVEEHYPYASFSFKQTEQEVILILCDIVGIMNNDTIEPIELFIDSIKLDLSIKKGDDNILFIHDNQINYNGNGFLVENNTPLNNCPKWAKDNKDIFKTIGYFPHDTNADGIFSTRIVKYNIENSDNN